MNESFNLQKKTIALVLTYMVLAASVGVFFPFNALYLSSTLGFSNTQISLIDGLGQLGAMMLLPIVGLISDRSKRPGLVFIALMLLSGLLMLMYANVTTFIHVAILYISYLAIRRGIFPVLDALTLNYCGLHNINFGIFRSIYSGTYMIFALLVGYLFNSQITLDNSFIYLSLIFNVIVIILAIFLPKIHIPDMIEESNHKKDIARLLKNSSFLVMSIAISLGMATVSIISIYNSTIIDELGGSLNNIGIATIMQVGSEVIFALFALKLAKKYSHVNVMLFAMFFLTVCWLVIYFNFRYNVYFSLIWIEGFATIFLLIVGMDYIKTIVNETIISTAITTFTAITLLFYFVLVNAAGIIRDTYSTKLMFLFLAATTLVACIIIILYKFQCTKKIS